MDDRTIIATEVMREMLRMMYLRPDIFTELAGGVEDQPVMERISEISVAQADSLLATLDSTADENEDDQGGDISGLSNWRN